jgi:site-specific DNA recombinase
MTDTLNQRPLIAGLYARVSTSNQEVQETIESQVEEIKLRIAADGNVLAQENIFLDDGWTGEMLQRPGLDLMRDAAMAGSFEVLYVYDRGRLSRVFAYQEIILEEVTNRDIKFVTLHDVAAQTAEEKVLQAMQGVFHEYERVKIAERMRRGKLYKAKNGVLINGSALYGYTYIKKTDTTPAHYEINEDEARVVKMIFEWVAIDRLSLQEVRKKLYELHIPPRKHKSEFWTKGPIVRLLQNESYFNGTIYYYKSEAVVARKPIKNTKYKKVKRTSRKARSRGEWIPFQVPPIIEYKSLFEKVQKILTNNKKYARKNRKYDYLLSGLAYCECGQRRVGDGYSKGGNHYYRCAERIYKFPMEKKCAVHGVNAVILDGFLWVELQKFLNDPETLKHQATEWLKKEVLRSSVDEQEKKKLLTGLGKIHEEELRYAKVYGSGTLEFEQFETLMKDLKKKKLSYEAQIKEMDIVPSAAVIDDTQIEALCEEAQAVIRELDLEDKKKTIHDIIDKVVIHDEGKIEVRGHVPLFTHNMAYEPIHRHCRFTKRR